MENFSHPPEVVQIHERILRESPAAGRFIDIPAAGRIHVIEAGSGEPLVMLHGTGAAAHTMLPIVEHLEGIRTILPDLPGSGLSDPVNFEHKGYREMAVEVTGQILDALELEQVTLAGSSGGGVWSIWYALANPERVRRLVLVGSAPLLPGTRPPIPLRIANAPLIGDLFARLPANEDMVVNLMGVMGEKETVVKHPQLLEGLVAANNDPIASQASRTEFSAFFNLLGFREHMKIRPDDLSKLRMPTLVIWGTHDPLGGADAARAVQQALPDSELELLPSGHVPWLGYPEQTARLIADFVRST